MRQRHLLMMSQPGSFSNTQQCSPFFFSLSLLNPFSWATRTSHWKWKERTSRGWVGLLYLFLSQKPCKTYSFYFILGWLPSILCFISFRSSEEPWQHWFQPMIAGEILNLIDSKLRISGKLDALRILKMHNFISSSWKVIACPQYDSFLLGWSPSNQLSHFALPKLSSTLCWLANLFFHTKHSHFLRISALVWKHMFFSLTTHYDASASPKQQQKPHWLEVKIFWVRIQ